MADLPIYQFDEEFSPENLIPPMPIFEWSGQGVAVVPDVLNFVPSVGSGISSGQAIQFDVIVSSGGFAKIVIGARYSGSDLSEMVFDGDEYQPYFASGSTKSVISGGFRFVIKRRGGWIADPLIRVIAISEGGGENV